MTGPLGFGLHTSVYKIIPRDAFSESIKLAGLDFAISVFKIELEDFEFDFGVFGCLDLVIVSGGCLESNSGGFFWLFFFSGVAPLSGGVFLAEMGLNIGIDVCFVAREVSTDPLVCFSETLNCFVPWRPVSSGWKPL